MELAPNQTLYINNLNEKLKKEELKKALYAMFSQFGPVLDIVALKTLKMKGQAFVVFRDILCATTALRTLQGFVFLGKPMRITYAKTKSDAIAKLDGSFMARDKAPYIPKSQRPKGEKQPGPRKPRAEGESSSSGNDASSSSELQKAQDQILQQQQQQYHMYNQVEVPNNILFVQNLPPGTSQDAILDLFKNFTAGSCDVRLVPNRQDIAFVEYENEMIAVTAKQALHGFKMSPTHEISVTYAKKD